MKLFRNAPGRNNGNEPTDLLWLIATISLLLPWIGGLLALAGMWMLLRDEMGGWIWLGLGAALLVFDIVIDLWIANPHKTISDQPALNARGHQYVGRKTVLVEDIRAGRGKVRLGDTLWIVSGPDMPQGTPVRIAAVKGTVLVVERV